MSKPARIFWNVIPFAIVWSIWKERNSFKFEGTQSSWEEICEQIKTLAAMWAKNNPKLDRYSINDLVVNPIGFSGI